MMIAFLTKNKKILLPFWCFLLIFFTVFIIVGIVKDRNQVKQYFFSYLLDQETKKYNALTDEISQSQAKHLNILCFYLNELKSVQNETKIDGGISFKVIKKNNPDLSPFQEKHEFNFIFESPKDKKEYNTINYSSDCKPKQFLINHKTDNIEENNAVVFEKYISNVQFIANRGNHLNYPLDKLNFNFPRIVLPSGITFQIIEFYNHTDDLILKSPPKIKISSEGNNISMEFDLDRLNTVKTIFWISSVVLLFYIFLVIFIMNEVNAVASSMGAVVFSLWGLDSILGQKAINHPNLLDLMSIGLIMLLLIGISTKVIFGYFKK